MARIRSLKPGFFKNEDLAELPFEHRLCFAGLWTLADREGRLEDRPRRIKGEIFPYDNVDVDAMLNALAERQFVIRYTADGVAYLAITRFAQHQRPKSDETESLIPAPSLSIPRGIVTPPRPYNGQRTEDRGQREKPTGAVVAPLVAADGAEHRQAADRFAELWNTLTSAPIPKCRELSSKRRRQIRSRLTERPLTEWQAVIERIQRSAFCRGQNDRGWTASFDWVVGSSDVAVKVLEGKYDDRKAQAKPTSLRPFGCRCDPPCRDEAEHTQKRLRQERAERAAV